MHYAQLLIQVGFVCCLDWDNIPHDLEICVVKLSICGFTLSLWPRIRLDIVFHFFHKFDGW